MKFEEIIKILWRRKFYILLPAIFIPIFAYLTISQMEREYEASTEIYIQVGLFKNSILQGFGLKLDLEGRLPTIKKLMKGEESIIYIIGEELSPEKELIVKERMVVELKGPGLIKVSFAGQDPKWVKEVANRMAKKFFQYALQDFVGIGKRIRDNLILRDEILSKQLIPQLYLAESRYQEDRKNYTEQSPELLAAKYKYESWKKRVATRKRIVVKKAGEILPLKKDELDIDSVTGIVVPAKVPSKPSKPQKVKLMVVAILGGISLGFILVFLMEFLDHSFRETTEVENFLEMKVLGRIPSIKEIRGKK
jgi:capsular polysaccharide biosynthesis protein